MSHYKENHVLKDFFKHIYLSYIPNKRDNLKQIFIKVLFIASFITLIVSTGYLANYFLASQHQNDIIDDTRELWHNAQSVSSNTTEDATPSQPETVQTVTEKLLAQNNDFKGWITISNTKVDNPIYQTDNNDYYLNHNQQKQKSAYGALYFDYKNVITQNKTDKNLVIFGHEMKNGSMFGTLKKLRSLDFYKKNPTIDFSTLYDKGTYKIYSIFVLNAFRSDDGDYIYNIYRNNFIDENDFDTWSAEAYERSIINTGVDIKYGDDIITLVTCCDDFEDARLVIMARKTREGEQTNVDTSIAHNNPNPRYPVKWYTERGIDYPF